MPIPETDPPTRDKFLNTLAESYVLHETILNSTELAVLSATPDGIISSVNASAEKMLGYDADDLVGKETLLIIYDADELGARLREISSTIGKKVKGVEVLLSQARKAKASDQREWTFITKSGSRIPVSVTLTAIRNDKDEVTGFLCIADDISGQRKIDQELTESRNHLQALIQSLDDIAFEVDQDGNYINVWTSRDDLLFGQKKSYQGRNIADVVGPALTKVYFETIARVLVTGKPETIEHPSIKPGLDLWYQAKITRLAPERLLILVREITEQRLSQLALIESEKKFRLLAENVPGVIYLCRNDEKYSNLFVSRNIEKITGYPYQNFLGAMDLIEVTHPDDRAFTLKEFADAVQQRKSYSIEYRIIHKSGEIKWVKETGAGLYSDHGLELIEGYISDITKRKNAELALLESEQKFRVMAESLLVSKSNLETAANELHEQIRQSNEFAHIISHNLRSPARNIQALISLLNEKSTLEEYKEVFDNLKKTSKSLEETLEELLDILKVKKEAALERTDIPVADVLNKVKNDLLGEILTTNTIITTDFSGCGNIHYYKPYLESIMLNLLSNAIKYRHPQRSPEIFIKTSNRGGRCFMEVTDNGLGIDMERHGEQLFGLRKVFHEHKESRGVGLFLTKTQIETMGGRIWAESKVGVGSSFFVSF